MRKIVQLAVGMYSVVDEDREIEEQRFAIIALCEDGSMWQKKLDEEWEEVETSKVTGELKAKKK